MGYKKFGDSEYSTNDSYDGVSKKFARDRALRHAMALHRKLLVSAWLPGLHHACLDQARQCELFDPRSLLFIAEWNPAIRKSLSQYMIRNFPHQFNDFNTEDYTEIEIFEALKKLGNRKLDFAFLDLCCELTYSTKNRLGSLMQNSFAVNSRASLTFSTKGRHNGLFVAHPPNKTVETIPPSRRKFRTQTVESNTHWTHNDNATLWNVVDCLPANSYVESVYKYVTEGRCIPMLLINVVLNRQLIWQGPAVLTMVKQKLSAKTPKQVLVASLNLESYVEARVGDGCQEREIRASIKAVITKVTAGSL